MLRYDILTATHEATLRDYDARDDAGKPDRMDIAMEFEEPYYRDPEGRFGYKDYHYIEGYWKPVAEKLIAAYHLDPRKSPRILDVGCGMGFLLHEIKLIAPNAIVKGFDISKFAVASALPTVEVIRHDASKRFPYDAKEFDLVISLNCLHNLVNYDRENAVKEIERVGHRGYIAVEGYRNNHELRNVQKWAMTCRVFQRPDEWHYEFWKAGYTGDCEIIFFK